ncbi:MAG: formate dehydrogenase accessory protein [marine bacterium B5-7]|nr:MAG: formate dehydrogenase accessory protein [marine bacterium B5-7]
MDIREGLITPLTPITTEDSNSGYVNPVMGIYKPALTCCGLDPTREVDVIDQTGTRRIVHASSELPLTIIADGQDIVTLMTLGTEPEKLTLGYLLNQRLIEHLKDIASVTVDWQQETARVATVNGLGIDELSVEPRHRIITTGCGQGTIYSCTLDKLYDQRLPNKLIRQTAIYSALTAVKSHNRVYRKSGSVHGCALIDGDTVVSFVEDVGRHNAMDTIAGQMWLDGIQGAGKIFYTTGRLTSEMVMKAAIMRIPVLVSRNGVTHMAVELAEDLNVMLVARAKSHQFKVFSNHDQLVFDAR